MSTSNDERRDRFRRSIRERVHGYAESVRNGTLPSCRMIQLAIERWYNDWRREDIYFDWTDVYKCAGLAGNLRHFKGEFSGRPIRLEDWQLFVIANIFGWKSVSTRRRRFNYADVYVPRKNGKTTFAAIIANFGLLLDGEAAAEVYAAAVDKEQARICFETAKTLLQRSAFADVVKIYRGSIVYEETASSFKPMSKDTKNKDGLNPSLAVCDERHAWATNEIYDVLKTGMGARSQPLIFSISTAGTDTSYPYFQDLEFLRDVLRGLKQKDNHFIMLYEPDEGDAWDSEDTWRKVNPNYGISLSRQYMENECREAREKGGSTLAAFQTKNLNKWVDAPVVWIMDDDVKANNGTFDESRLQGQDCYVGVDLASKTDISAVAMFFPAYNVVKYLFIVPEAKLATKTDIVDYRKWSEDGWLTVCPGNTLDEDWFVAEIMQALKGYHVKCIAYDPWGMWDIRNRFGRYEDVLMEYAQNIRNMSVPSKRMESMVLRHQMNFLGNPVIRWMFKNVVIYRDANANIKIDKARSRNKVDGVVALVDAIGGWLIKTNGVAPYANHTLRVVPRI